MITIQNPLSSVGLFAGIGGIELGFSKAGIATDFLCEIDPAAKGILSRGFPNIPIVSDVCAIKTLPKVDIVAGGFPCQNLSLVGNNEGIFGRQSGLIQEVFRLISRPRNAPRWLVLENVPFMLWQKKGEAIQFITEQLEALGFAWAYRVVDARSFGLPQRRRRVLMVASKTEDPRNVLLSDDAGELELVDDGTVPCGFYWTEGRAGLGWAVNGIPTLKGGSSIGIPSAPAIWDRVDDFFGTPEIRDGERLQGFKVDWTAISIDGKPIREGHRWKMVGNAVSVPVARWIGEKLVSPGQFDSARTLTDGRRSVWPNAAWGHKGKVFPVEISEFPKLKHYSGLREFLRYELKPLSIKASAGFLKRAEIGSLRFVPGFLDAVRNHSRRTALEFKLLKSAA